jgi:hypothetical protein
MAGIADGSAVPINAAQVATPLLITTAPRH